MVQNNLGHASVGATSMYLTTERDERMKAMRGFWKTVNSKLCVEQLKFLPQNYFEVR